jgi:3-hydroxyisobutyrate dehydrogenase-like beta-hydroxyacid dehydrogenase
MTREMKVGVIGLGHMGSGIAASLMRAGFDVTVYNRTREKAAPLLAKGAHLAATVRDACGGDAVITMLADDNAVNEVVSGNDGILASLPKDAIHMSSSTISVALSADLTERHARAGRRFIAAPVFGRPDVAAAGKLFVVAAGSSDTIAAVQPLLNAIGQKTFVISETPSAANLVKLSGNFLIATVIESLGEAMALIDKGGIDRRMYVDLLTSTLFGAPVYKTYGSLVAERRFEPAGFPALLARKDIRLALAAGEDLCVPLPIASLLRDRFLALAARGGDHLDWSAISELAALDSASTRPQKQDGSIAA